MTAGTTQQANVEQAVPLFAVSSMAGASGTFERFEIHHLRTAEEADKAVAAQVDWTPPGQGAR